MSAHNYKKPLCYHAYLLRFWEEDGYSAQSVAGWRFSLEDPRTAERQGFGNLDRLVAFLQQEIRETGCMEGSDA